MNLALKILNKKYMLVLALVLSGFSARANYDTACVERLMTNRPSLGMIEFKRSWDRALLENLQLERGLSKTEFEAIMDWYRGLSLIATFNDGKTTTLRTPNSRTFKKLGNEMKKRHIVAVTLLPEARARLGRILEAACETLRRPRCADYRNYFGLASETPRPMSAEEEQAVKWATLYMVSLDSMAETMRASPQSSRELIAIHGHAEEIRKEHARNIINERFSEADADILLKNYVEPSITANFARIMALYRGSRAH